METFLETILLAMLENSILPLCLSTKFKDKKKYTPFPLSVTCRKYSRSCAMEEYFLKNIVLILIAREFIHIFDEFPNNLFNTSYWVPLTDLGLPQDWRHRVAGGSCAWGDSNPLWGDRLASKYNDDKSAGENKSLLTILFPPLSLTMSHYFLIASQNITCHVCSTLPKLQIMESSSFTLQSLTFSCACEFPVHMY